MKGSGEVTKNHSHLSQPNYT